MAIKMIHKFVPITKVDAVNRLVYGRLTDETVDLSNEIMDYETSKPFFEKWSANAEKVSGGKSKGNLRAMHQPKAAGKFVDVTFDDATKSIDVCAKVVDDAEWIKVDEGVYTGFSLGGGVVGKMWKDPDSTAMRYTVDPIEGSLVDLPCNPNANFTHIKGVGLEEQTAFKVWAPDNADVAAKAVELAKAAGAPDTWATFLEDASKALTDEHFAEDADLLKAKAADEPEAEADKAATTDDDEAAKEAAAAADNADPADDDAKDKAAQPFELKQKWICSDGQAFEKKAEAKDHEAALEAAEADKDPLAKALAAATAKAAGEPEAEAKTVEIVTAEKAAEIKAIGESAKQLSAALDQCKAIETDGKVEKGLYSVSSLARILDDVACICSSSMWEAEMEGDASKVPAMLGEGFSQLGAALVAMATEEIAEIIAGLQGRGLDIVEIVGVDYVELAAVAEIVKANEPLMTKALAATAKPEFPEVMAETVEKLTAERDTLTKQIADAVPAIEKLGTDMGDLRKALTEAQAQIKALEAEPADMPKINAHLTEKVGDSLLAATGTGDAAAVVTGLVDKMGLPALQAMLIKHAQQNPFNPNAA